MLSHFLYLSSPLEAKARSETTQLEYGVPKQRFSTKVIPANTINQRQFDGYDQNLKKCLPFNMCSFPKMWISVANPAWPDQTIESCVEAFPPNKIIFHLCLEFSVPDLNHVSPKPWQKGGGWGKTCSKTGSKKWGKTGCGQRSRW